jgi:two-component system, chemotaxis family, chemotaxis protein CheY
MRKRWHTNVFPSLALRVNLPATVRTAHGVCLLRQTCRILQRIGGLAMPRRVLIVDDSMLMRRLVKETLVADGWEVVGEAANGDEAVERYQQLRPDAVTLDIVMPGTNGLQALKAILRIDPKARVVVVSALNQTKLISEAIRAGAEDFIAKPFMPEQLQDTLRSCLEEPVHA